MDETHLNLNLSNDSFESSPTNLVSTPRTYATLRPVSLQMSPIRLRDDLESIIDQNKEVTTYLLILWQNQLQMSLLVMDM